MASYVLVCNFSDAIPLSNPLLEDVPTDDADKYRNDLPKKYAEAKGLADPELYVLEHLPAGYLLCSRARQKGQAKANDKYLHGHPSGFHFDSSNHFLPHFMWLMDQGDPQLKGVAPCKCELCVGEKARGRAGHRSKQRMVGWLARHPGERGPNVPEGEKRGASLQGGLIQSLLREGWAKWWYYANIVPLSPVNLLRELPRLLPSVVARHISGFSACPRGGEVVLWCLPGLKIAPQTRDRRLDNEAAREWRAGVVVRASAARHTKEELEFAGPVGAASLSWEDVYQVQELPHLDDHNPATKSNALKQHNIPLSQLRPFYHFSELLKGTQQEEWDPSIKVALMMMASFALLPPFTIAEWWPKDPPKVKKEAKGKGKKGKKAPNDTPKPPAKPKTETELAVISPRSGILEWRSVWIGPEILHVGDAVRITPEIGGVVTDVMVIETISLAFDLRRDLGAAKEALTTSLSFTGPVFTTDATKADTDRSKRPIKIDACTDKLPKGMWGYEWYSYRKRAPIKLGPDDILGRCHDAYSNTFWFKHATINVTSEAIRHVRSFARANDPRFKISGSTDWFWCDSRTSQLEIAVVARSEEVWLTAPAPTPLYRLQMLSNRMGSWQFKARDLEFRAKQAQNLRLAQKAIDEARAKDGNSEGAEGPQQKDSKSKGAESPQQSRSKRAKGAQDSKPKAAEGPEKILPEGEEAPQDIKGKRATQCDDMPAKFDESMWTNKWAAKHKLYGSAINDKKEREAHNETVKKLAYTFIKPLELAESAVPTVPTAEPVDSWPSRARVFGLLDPSADIAGEMAAAKRAEKAAAEKAAREHDDEHELKEETQSYDSSQDALNKSDDMASVEFTSAANRVATTTANTHSAEAAPRAVDFDGDETMSHQSSSQDDSEMDGVAELARVDFDEFAEDESESEPETDDDGDVYMD